MEQKRAKGLGVRNENKAVSRIEKLRLSRIRDIKSKLLLLQEEIDRRKAGLEEEIKGIKDSTEMSEPTKAQLIGQVKQAKIIDVETIRLMLELRDRLDKLTFKLG